MIIYFLFFFLCSSYAEKHPDIVISLQNNSQNSVFIDQMQTYQEKIATTPIPSSAISCSSERVQHTMIQRSCWQQYSIQQLKNLASSRVVKIIAGLAACYGAVFLWIWWQGRVISKKDNWSNWKEDVPVSILQELPQQKQLEQLLLLFQEKYKQYNNVQAMYHFVRDIQCERDRLQQFLRIHWWLNTCKLGKLFPQQEELQATAQSKIQRLNYIYNVVSLLAPDLSLKKKKPAILK